MWIERYQPRWHSQLIELGNEVFGEGYFSEPWVRLQQRDSLMFVAIDDDDILGFAHGEILPRQGLDAYLGSVIEEMPSDIAEADAAGNLGVIDVVAVSAGHRRKGVGFSLLQATHDALVGAGADKLLVTFKRGPGSTAVEGLMTSLGFDLWQKLPSYWRDACNRGDFKCVDRTDTCVCEAMMFRKSVY